MPDKVRIDQWLWATRHLKSRSLATAAAKAGHVRINGEPVKPSSPVRIGDEIRLRINGQEKILLVTKLIIKRVGAPEASQCYTDNTPERVKVYMPNLFIRERGAGRPTKKERREMERLRGMDSNWGRL